MMAKRASSADVVIIGGGLMGCACALYLARQGIKSLVLERSVPGAEASSAAAGMLAPQAEAHGPGPMTELMARSAKLYPAFCQALQEATGIDVGYRQLGSIRIAQTPSQLGKLRASIKWQANGSQLARVMPKAALQRLEPALGPNLGGVLYPRDGQVDPRALFKAVHIAAERAGVRFETGRTVRCLTGRGERVDGAELEDGTRFTSGHVVIAAGSWTSLVRGHGLSSKSIIPARGQILELESPAPVIERVVFGPHCYLVPRTDGRTLVGSTLEFVGYERAVTALAARDLLTGALRLAPALKTAQLRQTWSNFRPYTPDQLPILGTAHRRGLLFAAGHYRTGILLAPVTAEIICRVVQGRRAPLSLRPFSPRRYLASE